MGLDDESRGPSDDMRKITDKMQSTVRKWVSTYPALGSREATCRGLQIWRSSMERATTDESFFNFPIARRSSLQPSSRSARLSMHLADLSQRTNKLTKTRSYRIGHCVTC